MCSQFKTYILLLLWDFTVHLSCPYLTQPLFPSIPIPDWTHALWEWIYIKQIFIDKFPDAHVSHEKLASKFEETGCQKCIEMRQALVLIKISYLIFQIIEHRAQYRNQYTINWHKQQKYHKNLQLHPYINAILTPVLNFVTGFKYFVNASREMILHVTFDIFNTILFVSIMSTTRVVVHGTHVTQQ